MTTEKRNLRPYVLGLCFFWGLVLGFIVYSTNQSTAERTEKEMTTARMQEAERLKKIAAEREKTSKTPTDSTKPVSNDILPPISVPALPSAKLKPEEDEVKTAARSKDWRNVPQIAKVTLNPAFGLTARTTPPPVPVDKLDIRETLRQNVAKNTASPGITLPAANKRPAMEDLPMPEID